MYVLSVGDVLWIYGCETWAASSDNDGFFAFFSWVFPAEGGRILMRACSCVATNYAINLATITLDGVGQEDIQSEHYYLWI